MLDFAEAGHWKRALILLLSCARLVRVQNLVLGTAALRSSEIPPRGGPGARGLRPLGEKGCFWTTFLGSDPSKPGIPHRKKTHPRQYGDLSNALSLVGRAPFLSGAPDRFWVAKVRRLLCLAPEASNKQASKQASITAHASEAVLYACYMRAKYVLYAC